MSLVTMYLSIVDHAVDLNDGSRYNNKTAWLKTIPSRGSFAYFAEQS
jgi:hypothetical protein